MKLPKLPFEICINLMMIIMIIIIIIIIITKSLYFSFSVFSVEHLFGTLSRSSWNLEILFFLGEGKTSPHMSGVCVCLTTLLKTKITSSRKQHKNLVIFYWYYFVDFFLPN